MSKKNNLPKYWVVKNPNKGFDVAKENDDIKVVMTYLDTNYGSNNLLSFQKYYGYDGNAGCESGTIYSDNEGQFENNPTLLTLEEFKKLIEND